MVGHLKSDQPLAGIAAEAGDWSLIGSENFGKVTSQTDRFAVHKFHHVEFWCGDASNTWRRFSWGLGMSLVAKSDQATGNQTYCSYVIQSNELVFSFTAPYSKQIDQAHSKVPFPGYDAGEANLFFRKHGLAVRAVGILVDDAEKAFTVAVQNGAIPILKPTVLTDERKGGKAKVAELKLYGDVVLRLISNHGFTGPYLPNFEPVESLPISYGIQRLDHAVGSVSNLGDTTRYLSGFTGFHEITEMVFEDYDTTKSGLKSLILANENEMVLLPLNQPLVGTERNSYVQTYLEHNGGPGLQHLALICNDIFSTVKEMHMRTDVGGFEFVPKPPPTYYKNLRGRMGGILTDKQLNECQELGILVDKGDRGALLQIFTRPVGDRPTVFIAFIQRVGDMQRSAEGRSVQKENLEGFSQRTLQSCTI